MDRNQVIRAGLGGFLGAVLLTGTTGATFFRASAAEFALGIQAFAIPGFLQTASYQHPAPTRQKPLPQQAANLYNKEAGKLDKPPLSQKVVIRKTLPKTVGKLLVEKKIVQAHSKAQPKKMPQQQVSKRPIAQAPPLTPQKLSLSMGGPDLAQAGPILKLPPASSEVVPKASSVSRSSSPKAKTAASSLKKARSKKVKTSPTEVPFVKQVSSGTLVLKSGITSSISELDLTVGRSKILDLQTSVARVSISNPDVASAVIVSPTQIQLIGKAPGVANLTLWNNANSSRYTVVDINVQKDVSVLAKQLKLLDSRINIEPIAAQNTILLSGEADTAEAAQVAVELAKAFFMNAQSSGGGGASPLGGAGGGGSSGGGAQGGGLTSLAPGTSLPGSTPQIVNMIKVKGLPTTKVALVRERLHKLDPNIQLDVIPAAQGAEKVILTGRVATSGVISKAINIASVFYGQPGMKVITGPGGKMIRPSGSPSFQTDNAFDDNLDINILQGSVVTDTTGNVVSMLEVAEKPQIRCSIRFLNVQRAALRQLGGTLLAGHRDLSFGSFSAAQAPLTGRAIALPSGLASANQSGRFNYRGVPDPASKTGTYTSNFSQALGSGITQAFTINQVFQLAISALEERRKVKSLAEPTLTLLSGEKASFLAGGELPIPVLGTNGQISIDYHQFGIRLNLIGTVNDDGKIHLQVAPEVSTVDPTNSITTTIATIPGFATRRMQTTLELNNGESFVLAGLFSQEESEIFSRFPGVGSLPILGTFFKGKNSDARSNEMIVIIRPEIVSSPNGQIWQSSTSPGGAGKN